MRILAKDLAQDSQGFHLVTLGMEDNLSIFRLQDLDDKEWIIKDNNRRTNNNLFKGLRILCILN